MRRIMTWRRLEIGLMVIVLGLFGVYGLFEVLERFQ